MAPLPRRGGPDGARPSRAAPAPHNNLVVVGFDPVADPAALATFCARFGVETTTMSFLGALEGAPNAPLRLPFAAPHAAKGHRPKAPGRRDDRLAATINRWINRRLAARSR